MYRYMTEEAGSELNMVITKSIYQCVGYTTFDEIIDTFKDDFTKEGTIELIHFMNSLIIELKCHGGEEISEHIVTDLDCYYEGYCTDLHTLGANNEVI